MGSRRSLPKSLTRSSRDLKILSRTFATTTLRPTSAESMRIKSTLSLSKEEFNRQALKPRYKWSSRSSLLLEQQPIVLRNELCFYNPFNTVTRDFFVKKKKKKKKK